MVRIILINRYFYPDESATAQLLTDLAQSLADEHEVVALCSRQRLNDAGAHLPTHDHLGQIRIQRLWSTTWGRSRLAGRALDYASFLISAGFWLSIHLRRGDVLLVKTDPPMLGVIAALASLVRGVSLVHWLQDLYPETAWRLGVTGEASLPGRALRTLRNWSLRRARLTVVVSSGMGAYLQREARIVAPCYIPNWADDLRQSDVEQSGQSSYRDAFALGDKFVIGYSGNLGRAHPVTGLKVLARRLRQNSECHFFFTGGGAHFELLRAYIEREDISNWSFLPYQPRERLPELLATADLHLVVLDPRLERFVFPSKLYGVLSAGRPVLHLGDPAGEVASLVREYRCGWSLRPDDVDAILGLLAHLQRNRGDLNLAGSNARRAYETLFSRFMALNHWRSALTPMLR